MNFRNPGQGPPVISVSGVSRTYREGDVSRDILSALDLEIHAGEFVAIGGPSGSGKSTLLNLLGGLDQPDRGSIRVAGKDMGAMSVEDRTLHRRANIGIVFQFFNLVPTLSVEENLRLPLLLNGLPADEDLIERGMEEFDLSHRRHAYPQVLSGGEQQRVAILRAAIHEPPVILADEPTGNLDQARGAAVIELLRKQAEKGICVVMVTHSRRAASVATRRLQLTAGKLQPWDW